MRREVWCEKGGVVRRCVVRRCSEKGGGCSEEVCGEKGGVV